MTDLYDDWGGPAFPIKVEDEIAVEQHLGMSLRDWFAGQAMQGLAAQFDKFKMSEVDESLFGLMATVSYRFADAMLKARDA